MKKFENETLLVKHLPSCFTEDDCKDFFKQLGAVEVKYMGQKGSMKHTAFVTFQSAREATNILNKLHQLSFLGTILVVEYSKSYTDIPTTNNNYCTKAEVASKDEHVNQLSSEHEKLQIKQKYVNDLNSISSAWNFDYGFKNDLYYSYPPPSMSILINITNALASVPKFYVQVLHLMNKMNLPAPFGPVTLTPPIPDDTIQEQPIQRKSSSESELESDDEKMVNKSLKRKVNERDYDESLRKRLKLQFAMEAQLQAMSMKIASTHSEVTNPSEVFEHHECVDKSKKIDIKIPPSVSLTEGNHKAAAESREVHEEQEVGGFGKITPADKKHVQDAPPHDKTEWGKQEFMSKEDMAKNQLPLEELEKLFNYKKGMTTSRLYIKNLSKTVIEKDLHFVFGKYVNWDSDEKNRYDISLMKQGRMKGQAFITLPSEIVAERAIEDANGLFLHGKPIVVQFSRSSK